MMGTLLFAAPESLAAARDVGPAADVYSLGSTTVFALRGEALPPDHYRDPSRAVAALEVSEELRGVLARGTALDVANRFQTVAEYCSALEEAARRPGPASTAVPRAEPRQEARKIFPEPTAITVVEEEPALHAEPREEAPEILTESPSGERSPKSSRSWLTTIAALATIVSAIIGGISLWSQLKPAEVTDPPAEMDTPIPNGTVEIAPPVTALTGVDEELFLSVQIGQGKQVDLWSEIPEGEFWMGSTEEENTWERERPRHLVTVKSGFWMAVVPVTNAQYAAFKPEKANMDLPNHPVVNVSWDDAMAFCKWLGQTFDWAKGTRLPTEVEWEYAARAGTKTAYWNGDPEGDLKSVGWYSGNSGFHLHPVGEKLANPWDLYDVHGNVWEWTLSLWSDDYSKWVEGRTIDPVAFDPADLAAPSGARRVMRGGSYWGSADGTRAADPNRDGPDTEGPDLGFRVCCRPRRPEALDVRP